MTDTAITKKTVTVVDKATKGIIAATKAAVKTMEDLNSLVTTSEALAFDIEAASDKLAAIEVDTKTSLREAKADLAIRIKENADGVLSTLMKERNLATITNEELSSVRLDLIEAKADNDKEVEKNVSIAVNKAKSAAALDMSKAMSEAAVEAAQRDADNSALRQQIDFLEKTVQNLEQSIKDERQARVEIAATTSAPTVNVSSAK